jgi:cytochrome bd ubiquinol oxidase subunit II
LKASIATEPAPLFLFGWVNENKQRVQFGIAIPRMLSYLTYGDVNKPVTGLQAFPPQDRPPINFVFQTYHGMVAIGFALIGLSLLGVFLWWRGLLFAEVGWVRRYVLPLMVFSVLGPQLANQLGWFSAEVGRQPWIVYGLLRTSDALSKVVKADAVLTSLILFTIIYVLLFILFIFLLNEKIQHGPEHEEHPGEAASVHAPRNFEGTARMNFFFAQTLAGGSYPSLNEIWFVLVGVLFTGYVMLDGFDLGVGALQLFTKTDEERRLMLNAIGPVWDGNEVWLVTGGGALFAAFPEVYATVFSGFYLAFVLLLFSLIFRAVAIEFRSKRPEAWWRQTWDVLFSLGSVLSSFLIGVAIGNIVWGVPLDKDHEFAGTFLGLLGPYPILLGITTVALFAMHGAIYVVMKTEGELQARARGWIQNAIIFFVLAYAATSLATLLYIPRMSLPLQKHPWLFIIPLLNILAVANIPREIHLGNEFKAFLSSCAAMIALMALFGVGMYPHMVFCDTDPANSLDIFNAASSQKTLGIMLIIACMGVPIVLAYTVCIYWIFRGKVKLESMSY